MGTVHTWMRVVGVVLIHPQKPRGFFLRIEPGQRLLVRRIRFLSLSLGQIRRGKAWREWVLQSLKKLPLLVTELRVSIVTTNLQPSYQRPEFLRYCEDVQSCSSRRGHI